MKKISISGVIGWDAMPDDLRAGLESANGQDVEITISSPGGFVGDGLEMFNLIRNYEGHTTAILSGYAMSMASYIPLAADTITAEDNAIYMIHNVQGGVYGDHNEILKYGTMTEGMSNMLARGYAKRTGKDVADIKTMMDAETYLFGQDMVDQGFVDSLIDTDSDTEPETAQLTAKLAFEKCNARMNEDVTAVKNDLTKAAALCSTKADTGQKKEVQKMDLKALKKDHPDLVSLIVSEATAGHDDALVTATEKGAKAENKRIADVTALTVAGHEELIATLSMDGVTTAPEAAVKVLQAQQATALELKAAAKEDGIEPVKLTQEPVAKKKDGEWANDADLRAEFGNDEEAYKAYMDADNAGLAKIR